MSLRVAQDPVKTLDDENGDENGGDLAANGDHTSDDLEEGGESQSQIPEVNEEVELDADEAKTKKRRLDADELEDERAGEQEGAVSDDADHGKGVEVSGEKDDGVEGSVEEESAEEPPRKKAKNNAA